MTSKTQMAEIAAKAEKIAKSQQKIQAAIETAKKTDAKLGVEIDMDNVSLTDIQSESDQLRVNAVELVAELDRVTAAFGTEFQTMQQKTGMEKFVGFFLKGKSDQMRESRLRSSSISNLLQDMIDKSLALEKMMKAQEVSLREGLAVGKERLELAFQSLTRTNQEIEQADAEIVRLEGEIGQAEARVAEAVEASARTQAEEELMKLNGAYNELVNERRTKLTEAQSYENYIAKFTTMVNSFEDQIANQQALIAKNAIDREERTVLYDMTERALKTAQQQETAHRLNELGSATDAAVAEITAGIGAASNARMAKMLEGHAAIMAGNEALLRRKQKADEEFMRRFGAVLEEHRAGTTGENAPAA